MRRGESGINRLLALDKPLGLTSHDVVSRVRRALGERRVGHAGTLDPAASGVLVVGVGQATRLMGLLAMDDKSYEALVAFGSETDTEDGEGTVTATAPVPEALHDPAFAREALSAILGEQDQLPPAYSAISVNGRRAYDLARAGEEVVLEPRRIRIDKAQLVGIEEADELVWRCRFVVSKGTYVRSIARDLGRSLGTAAHLVGLRRTGAGSVRIEGCLPLAALEAAGTQMLDRCTIDPTSALGHAVMRLDDRGFERVSCGHQLFAPSEVEEGERVSLVHDGRLVGVWCRRGSRLVCVANFPQGISGVLS